MLLAKVKIIGTKPLIFHKFNIECISNLSKVKSGSAGNDPEEWRNGFFSDENRLYLPGTYFVSCFRNGSVHTKVGRGTIQKSWMSAVQVEDEKIYLNRCMPDKWQDMSTADFPKDSSSPVYLDVRMVSNPNTKGRNVRYRIALSPGWKCELNLMIDDTIVSKEIVKKVIDDTGKLQGIADSRTLGYGRFNVEEIEFSKL